ncbi:MAG TPA: hypothetical protein VG603_01095 [Chitinophagales bacterium]|nr:hypothetical protein [Chitinophagales bacterium]
MKTPRKLYFFTLVCLAALLAGSCTKQKEDDSSLAEDHAAITMATDGLADDASSAAGQVKNFSGKTDETDGWWQLLCGVASVDTNSGHQITLTYDSTASCVGIIKSGQISISLNGSRHWRDQGAELSITLNNFKIANRFTGRYFILNGTETVTNETGGLAWLIMAGITPNATVAHRHRVNNLTITYSDGSQRTWNVDRTRTFTSVTSSGHNTISITVSSENTGNEDTWGTNRNGAQFISSLITPVISNNNANCPYKPYQGEYSQQVGSNRLDVLYGVDENGNPTGNPDACAYGYKITYQSGRKIFSKILSY